MPFSLFTQTLDVGGLELNICLSHTANLFHVIDQLAAWSPYCHGQYRRWYEETADGKALFTHAEQQALANHARLRQERSWGMGLEQAFYTPLGLEEALEAGVQAGHLSPEQAQTEFAVFTVFAPRIEELLRRQWPTLEAFAGRLAAGVKELEAFAAQVGRFVEVKTLRTPVYLIANPSEHGGGGGFNGGRLTVEVSPVYDAYPTFLHELFHAFLDMAEQVMRQAVEGIDGLSLETLNEGIAYALSPGLIHAAGEGADPLAAHVGRSFHAFNGHNPLADNYLRFNAYGLALRPLLKAALQNEAQTLTTFLPRAIDAWRVLSELSMAMGLGLKAAQSHNLPSSQRPLRRSLFVFGPCARLLLDERWNRRDDIYGRSHIAAQYAEVLAKAQAEDRVVLLLAGDSDETVPDEYLDLLPVPLSHIQTCFQNGQTLEQTHRARAWNIVLLAAPTREQLTALIRQTPLLN